MMTSNGSGTMRIAALISALTLLLAGPALAEMEKPKSSDPAVQESTNPDASNDSGSQPDEVPKVESSDPHPDE
jgi:hypothetical protein